MNKTVEHDLNVGHLVECQICGCADLIPIIDLGFIAPCDSLLWPEQLKKGETLYPLNLVRCAECTLVQIDYVVDPEELFFPEYPYRSGITPTLVDNLRSTGLTVVNRYNIAKGSLAIDIGSNDGTLLTGFKDIGLRVLGVEPTNIAEIANGNGIETIQEFFTEDVAKGIVEKYGSASVVTAANMFAHVAQLGSLIRGAEHLLVDDGLFVTESHYLLDLLDTVQYDTIYHEHLKYYSMHSIIRLFDDYGFTVVDVDRISNYGGSIRVYAMKGKGREVRSSVTELLTEEMTRGIGEAKIFDKFVKKVRQSKLDLRKLIVEAQENGEEVVGVGSPGRAATLLGYCKIDVDQMTYIAEQSTSLKLGLFMPGVHIPIVDEERLLREQPAYAVLLSWHYWQPIVKKLREKGLKSKIVLPLPELVILED